MEKELLDKLKEYARDRVQDVNDLEVTIDDLMELVMDGGKFIFGEMEIDKK